MMEQPGDFTRHILHLIAQADAGDNDARRTLACMKLLIDYLRPDGPGPDGGCEVIDLAAVRLARAA